MSEGELQARPEIPATHVLTADSSEKPSNLTRRRPDGLLRSQRWRSVAEVAVKDEASSATGLDPLQWESLSALPESHTAEVPDLDRLLDLNGLAQPAVPPGDADTQQLAPLQVMVLIQLSCMCTRGHTCEPVKAWNSITLHG